MDRGDSVSYNFVYRSKCRKRCVLVDNDLSILKVKSISSCICCPSLEVYFVTHVHYEVTIFRVGIHCYLRWLGHRNGNSLNLRDLVIDDSKC
jgi:hypothetical protein